MRTPSTPASDQWAAWTPEETAEYFGASGVRWWLSGGVALERWHGEPIREHANIDVSTLLPDVRALAAALPSHVSAWARMPEGLVPLADLPEDADIQKVDIHDDERGAWVLRINVEDGAPKAWVYRRDPRLMLPWDKAVLDVDGIPTGAPAVQLLWKALRPRPVDDLDKDAILPKLSDEERAWLETALLRIHPHSSWAIHVRSPFAPAKASWNRKRPS